tara:strand:- start:1826 stop:2263 length:438 start_codon:yes stop_codon:yes gene_type:complete
MINIYQQREIMNRINFFEKWGIRCNEIAEIEGVTPEAIRMRVKNFGNPWQRAKKASKFELKYGKTIKELAEAEGVHPVTIARREYLYGDAYYITPLADGSIKETWNKGKTFSGEHWSTNPNSGFSGSRRGRPQFMDQYYDRNKKS